MRLSLARCPENKEFLEQSQDSQSSKFLNKFKKYQNADKETKKKLNQARDKLPEVILPTKITELCVRISQEFQAEGHRGDYIMALGARAHAALRGADKVELADILAVAPLALQHRRPAALQGEEVLWTEDDTNKIKKIFKELVIKGVNQTGVENVIKSREN